MELYSFIKRFKVAVKVDGVFYELDPRVGANDNIPDVLLNLSNGKILKEAPLTDLIPVPTEDREEFDMVFESVSPGHFYPTWSELYRELVNGESLNRFPANQHATHIVIERNEEGDPEVVEGDVFEKHAAKIYLYHQISSTEEAP